MSQLQKVAEKWQNLIPLFGALLLEMCFCSSFAPPRPNRTLKSLPHTETTALKNCPHHRRRLRLQKVAEKIQKWIPLVGYLLLEMCFCSLFARRRSNEPKIHVFCFLLLKHTSKSVGSN